MICACGSRLRLGLSAIGSPASTDAVKARPGRPGVTGIGRGMHLQTATQNDGVGVPAARPDVSPVGAHAVGLNAELADAVAALAHRVPAHVAIGARVTQEHAVAVLVTAVARARVQVLAGLHAVCIAAERASRHAAAALREMVAPGARPARPAIAEPLLIAPAVVEGADLLHRQLASQRRHRAIERDARPVDRPGFAGGLDLRAQVQFCSVPAATPPRNSM